MIRIPGEKPTNHQHDREDDADEQIAQFQHI